jgi:hypothetical protein
MNVKLLLSILIILSACTQNTLDNKGEEGDNKEKSDVRVAITNETTRNVFTKRITNYNVIYNSDTSDFTCIFSEHMDGKIILSFNLQDLSATTYNQRLNEIKTILPVAENDYNFDSLKVISYSMLILSGDLAIYVTEQYKNKFGDTISDHKTVELFLKESRLGADLNSLFKPFSIEVKNVNMEKLHFIPREILLNYELHLYYENWLNQIETDPENIPEKILNCSIWVNMKKTN